MSEENLVAANTSRQLLRQWDRSTGVPVLSPKWARAQELVDASLRLQKANLRLRAASVKREGAWDPLHTNPLCAWLRDDQHSPRSKPRAKATVSARSLLRRSEAVREQLGRWWEMLANDAVGINYTAYAALQLRLYKVLVPPPFDRAAAEAEADAGWKHECPAGGRTLSRHLLQESLFDIADQRTRSTTPEECAAFLDLLFGAITTGCPPSLRKLSGIEHYDVAAQAVSLTHPAIRRETLAFEAARALARASVGDGAPMLELKTPVRPKTPQTPRAQTPRAQTPRVASARDVVYATRIAALAASGSQTARHVSSHMAAPGPQGVPANTTSDVLLPTIPYAFDPKSAPPTPIKRKAGRPMATGESASGDPQLTTSEEDGRARSASPEGQQRPDGPVLVSSLRVGSKTKSLAVTLSSNKLSALAGAPCPELPNPPASANPFASRSRSPNRDTPSTLMTPTQTSVRPPVLERPVTVGAGPQALHYGNSLRAMMLQARVSQSASIAARSPRSERRRQQWMNHEGVRPLPMAVPNCEASHRGLIAMRRREQLSTGRPLTVPVTQSQQEPFVQERPLTVTGVTAATLARGAR